MKRLLVAIAVMAAVYLSGRFGLSLAAPAPGGSAVWPPAGLGLAAMLLFGYRLWPAIALGTFLVDVEGHMGVMASAGVALGNSAEALAGAFLVNRFAQGTKVFHQANSIFRFILITAISTVISALIGAVAVCLDGGAPWRNYPEIWTTWWVGNYVSDLILAPVILIWADRSCRPGGKRWGEAVCLFVLLVMLSQAVFAGWFSNRVEGYPLEYLTIPILLWAALRFGSCAASTATLVLSVMAVAGTARGFGPFGQGGPNESFLLLLTFLATVNLTALVAAAILGERRRVEAALRQSELQLRFVWENSIDGMRLMNEEGTILAVNGAYCQLMERARESLEGHPVSTLYPDNRREEMMRHYREFFRERTFEPHVEKQMVLAGGKKIELELSNSFLDLEGQRPLLLSVFRNITERKKGEALQAEFSLLGQNLSAARTATETARTIMAAAEKLLGWDACTVCSYSDEKNTVYAILTMDTIEGKLRDVAPPVSFAAPTPRLQRAIKEGGYLISQENMAAFPPDSPRFGDVTRGSASILVVPIRHGEKITGVLSLHSYDAKAYTEGDLQTLQALADHCGGALERIHVAEELAKQQEFVRAAFTKLGEGLNAARSALEAARAIGEVADDLFGWDSFTLNLYEHGNGQTTIQPILNVDTIEGRRSEIPNTEIRQNFTPRDLRILQTGGELLLKQEPIAMSPELVSFGDTKRPSASMMFVPIRNRTLIVGILSVHSYAINAYNREDLRVLQTLADYCGSSLERVRAETALRESDALKGAIMESALDCIITMDRAGKILEFNTAAQKTFACSREEALGREMAEWIIPPAYRERLREGLRHYVATGDTVFLGTRIEITARRRDGTEFPAELAITPLQIEGGPIFTAYLRDITERKRAEKTLREIPGQILQAQESERMRVARELHDSVNQILSATKFRLDSAAEGEPAGAGPARENFNKARELLDKAMHEVWRISRNLRPSELDDLGLAPAMRSLCLEFKHRTGVNVDLQLARTPPLPPGIELTLYRIVQEALNNVEKHSEASEVRLSLAETHPWITLHIEDNGVGLPPANPRRKAGMGLVGMQERVAFAGGVVEVKSTPTEGTMIEVKLPLPVNGTEQP